LKSSQDKFLDLGKSQKLLANKKTKGEYMIYQGIRIKNKLLTNKIKGENIMTELENRQKRYREAFRNAVELEQKNEDLRKLLDKASQAISCFVELRGMTATELKSAHNGICILLEKTKMLDAIKAGVGEGEGE
jgi:hypothetical protein